MDGYCSQVSVQRTDANLGHHAWAAMLGAEDEGVQERQKSISLKVYLNGTRSSCALAIKELELHIHGLACVIEPYR